jgi:diguanylate cyclase (GGDEF)-like protein/PAS domain S-box-containing protein
MGEKVPGFAQRALETSGVGGWEVDLSTSLLRWSDITFAIHDLEPGEPPSLAEGLSFYPPEARQTLVAALEAARRDGLPYDLELPFVTAKGRHIWVRSWGRPIYEDGKITRITGAFQDVTARHDLTKHAERLSLVVQKMTNAVIMTDARGCTEWSNEAFTRLTGIPPDDMIGHHPGSLLQGEGTDPATRSHMRACIERGEGFETEVLNYTRDAKPYWIGINCTALRDDGGVLTGFIAVESDVTARREAEARAQQEAAERRRAEATLRHQAEHDPLTDLANRSALLAAFERALATSDSPEARGGALVLFDVDLFKQINDTRGHDVGDALLVELARRLRGLAGPGDVVARLGGDEFALLAPGAGEPEAAAARVRGIYEALTGTMELLGRRVDVSVSSGVTVFPTDGRQVARLLKNADLALYEAKRSGRATWRAFRAEQAEALDRRTQMAEGLRRALAGGQITVTWQPRRRLRGGHAGFEAVPHWHDGRRSAPPAEFLPVAEEAGLTGELGRVVMEGVLTRMTALRAVGCEPGRIAINVYSRQVREPGFVTETIDLMRRFGLDPGHLEIKVTEEMVLGRAGAAVEDALVALHESGITSALETGAGGLVSLATLARLPFGRIRIDPSFIGEIGTDRRGGAIVRAAIGLAHGLGFEAVAAGVETPAQLLFLEEAGCDVVQGPLIAPLMTTTEEAAAYLAHSRLPPPDPETGG